MLAIAIKIYLRGSKIMSIMTAKGMGEWIFDKIV